MRMKQKNISETVSSDVASWLDGWGEKEGMLEWESYDFINDNNKTGTY